MSTPGDGSVGPGEKPREALKIMQIQGSSAGAGSGSFHTYRNDRNLERQRLARMDRDASESAARDQFERDRAIANFHLDQAAKKRSEKRKRKKDAKESYEKKAKLESSNALPNDGSFMELFMKKQAELAAKQTGSSEAETTQKQDEASEGATKGSETATGTEGPTAEKNESKEGDSKA